MNLRVEGGGSTGPHDGRGPNKFGFWNELREEGEQRGGFGATKREDVKSSWMDESKGDSCPTRFDCKGGVYFIAGRTTEMCGRTRAGWRGEGVDLFGNLMHLNTAKSTRKGIEGTLGGPERESGHCRSLTVWRTMESRKGTRQGDGPNYRERDETDEFLSQRPR